jgi:hypothetical protein
MAFNSHQSFQEMDDTCWFRCGFRAFPADNYFLLTLVNKASNNDTTRVYQIAFFLIRNPIESVILRNSLCLLLNQSESHLTFEMCLILENHNITSRPPLTSPDPTQTSHINPHLIHVNMLTLPKLSKM